MYLFRSQPYFRWHGRGLSLSNLLFLFHSPSPPPPLLPHPLSPSLSLLLSLSIEVRALVYVREPKPQTELTSNAPSELRILYVPRGLYGLIALISRDLSCVHLSVNTETPRIHSQRTRTQHACIQ